MEYRNNKIKGYKVDYDLIRREENLSYNERIDFRVNALSIESMRALCYGCRRHLPRFSLFRFRVQCMVGI